MQRRACGTWIALPEVIALATSEAPMNYPLWDIPAPGLLIAFVAIVHVFISHFAVGGGLFLVVAERKARRDADPALLAYVERHSRFFAMLTLVAGALTGVGIWFTIGLIHPAATASLVASFVWGWAIEWTFFVTEITAALVYAYGWNRLSPATHERVGWIYFAAAWLSLAVINGILSFMLTPGHWIVTRSFWDGILNPTYLPSLVARTAGAVALAGVYALMTVWWMADGDAKARIARYAGIRWVLPGAAILPVSIAWYLGAASAAGVPVAQAFGAAGASIAQIARAAFASPATGYPMAQRAVVAFLCASGLLALTTLVIVIWRPRTYGRIAVGLVMASAFVALGASEWIREDLRKPYVIGNFMFVTGVRVPPSEAVARAPHGAGMEDRFTLDVVERTGVLSSSSWTRPAATTGDRTADEIARGRELFRLSCAACHTTDGYLAIRPLVRGLTVPAATGVIARLARPVDDHGKPVEWTAARVRIASWRGRLMPPFPGTSDERRALATYLASLGGLSADALARSAEADALGARLFEEHCAACHSESADYPFKVKGRNAGEFYALIGRLPELDDAMGAFEGTDAERRALAEYLPTLDIGPQGGSR